VLAGLLVVALAGYVGVGSLRSLSGSSKTDRPLLGEAKLSDLRIVVTERGNVESRVTINGTCELNGYQNKIIFLVPEGAKVKKGQVVCKFDDSEIQKNLAQQDIRVKQAVARIEAAQQDMEIQRNACENSLDAATVALSLAKLDLEKYQQGDYPIEVTAQEGDIKLKKKDLEQSSLKLEQFRTLLKKGFKTPEQVRIQEADLARTALLHSNAELSLKVKQVYDNKRKLTEYKSKLNQAGKTVQQAEATLKAQMIRCKSELAAALATSEIEQQILKDYLKQKELAVIKAQQDGLVAYANDRYWDPSSQIREGATVYSRQRVFTLPDMTKMQVKANIHESLIKKLKPEQKAEIRIDAFPSTVFQGTVKSVSQLADSTRPGQGSSIKEYPVIVTVDSMNGQEIKPGMTAEVKIVVHELEDVLCAPVQAVIEHKGEFFAYVDSPHGLERRRIKVGESNETHIQVLDGLTDGDRVGLSARLLANAEFRSDPSDAADPKGDGARHEDAAENPK
jgi:multidrug efflux pump subunit AcrA (membrane-fusion protein)